MLMPDKPVIARVGAAERRGLEKDVASAGGVSARGRLDDDRGAVERGSAVDHGEVVVRAGVLPELLICTCIVEVFVSE